MKFSLSIFTMLILVVANIPAQETPQTTSPLKISVDDAVQLAMKRSPDIRIARAEVEAARAETRGARSKLRPQLGLNGFATTGTMQNIVSTPPGFDPANSIIVPEKGYLDANFMLMAPIYTGGTLEALVLNAEAREQASRATEAAMRSEVALMVRDSYLRALLASELAAAQQTRINAAQEMVRTTQAEYEAGRGIKAAVQRAEAELAEARQMLTMLQNDQAKMVVELSSVIGLSPGTELVLLESLIFSPLSEVLDDYLKRAGLQRGELQTARLRQKAAEAQVRAAQGAVKPQVYGYAMADAFKATGGGMSGGTGSGSTLGLAFSFPLYDAGMRRSDIAKMKAMFEAARSETERWELRTDREVRQAWLDIQTAIKTRESALAGLESARAAYEVATLRVQSGKGILLEQLDALAAMIRAKANLSQATYDHQIAVARLQRATGGI